MIPLHTEETNKVKPIYVNIKNENAEIYLHHKDAIDKSYMRYSMEHCKKPYVGPDFESYQNQDLWRLMCLYDYRSQEGFAPTIHTDYELVNGGEWECAIRIKDTHDFHGGLHGSECYEEVSLFADGCELNIFGESQLWADKVNFYQKSNIYLQGTKDETIAVHHKWYEFASSGVSIHQKIEWKGSFVIEKAFLAMLPIKRESESGISITDRARIDGLPKVYDVSRVGHELNGGEVMRNVKSAEVWGEKSGIYAKVTLLSEPSDTNTFFIQNNAMYNKIYFSYAGDGGKHITKCGEEWEMTSHYDIYMRTPCTAAINI